MNAKRFLILAMVGIMPATLVAQNKGKANKAPASQPAIITLGKVQVPTDEFSYYYQKNNANAEDAFTEKGVREYLDLYINFKLKVMDAERLKMDTSSGYQKELESYRKQLSQPYLTDKDVNERLVKEAYDRMKEEVNASHILITCAPDASPKDSLAAYKRIMSLRERAMKGEDFSQLAFEHSDDPSAKQNRGKLGYFSALQMVFPFENAAFETKVGSISQPVRTRFGFHIIKVNDRRPAQGKVKVSHIMVRLTPEMSPSDSVNAAKQIDEIYNRVQRGENFAELAKQFSDDLGTKEQGGELPEFGTGQMIPEFEEPTFKLKNEGDVTKPFKTAYGFHIVKLHERKGLEPFEDMQTNLAQRVQKDSRSSLNRESLVAKLKKENDYKENAKVLRKAVNKADTSLLSGNWKYNRKDKLNDKVLFSIGKDEFTVRDFFIFVESTQKPHPNSDPQFIMKVGYEEFVDNTLIKHEEENLSSKYEDYRMLVKEYRDGILLFQLMEDKVWNKAIEDTAGLREYFEANNNKYQWGTRARARIFSVADDKVLAEVKRLHKANFFPVNEPKFADITYDKNEVAPNADAMRTINSVFVQLRNSKTMKVNINGYVAKGEKSALAAARAKAIADTLEKRGLPKSQINVVSMAKAKPADAGSKVTFALLDSSAKAMERLVNADAPLNLQASEGMYSKGDNKHLDKVQWKPGEYTTKDGDRTVFIVIERIEEPRKKRLDEARGLAISDYQNHLEKLWLEGLRKQHPVKVNEAEVAKLIKK